MTKCWVHMIGLDMEFKEPRYWRWKMVEGIGTILNTVSRPRYFSPFDETLLSDPFHVNASELNSSMPLQVSTPTILTLENHHPTPFPTSRGRPSMLSHTRWTAPPHEQRGVCKVQSPPTARLVSRHALLRKNRHLL